MTWIECPTPEQCNVQGGECLSCGEQATWSEERPVDLLDDSEPEEASDGTD